jgi:hypothetical protein
MQDESTCAKCGRARCCYFFTRNIFCIREWENRNNMGDTFAVELLFKHVKTQLFGIPSSALHDVQTFPVTVWQKQTPKLDQEHDDGTFHLKACFDRVHTFQTPWNMAPMGTPPRSKASPPSLVMLSNCCSSRPNSSTNIYFRVFFVS